MKLVGLSTKNSYNNKNKVSLFNLELNYKNNAINEYKIFSFSNKKRNNNINTNANVNDINRNRIKTTKYRDNKKRAKSGFIKKKIDAKSIVNKLEKKKNQELLDTLLYRNNVKNDYNSKIYELFKQTECF